MSDEKKMTTGGFFRGLLRHALTGGKTPNPVDHVIRKGLEAANGEKTQEDIETTGEEVQEAPSRWDPNDEGTPRKDGAPKA